MALNSPTIAERGATGLPHLEFGIPKKLAGVVSPQRFVSLDSSGNVVQSSAGDAVVLGVYPELVAGAAGEEKSIALGPTVVIADDVIAPGKALKAGNGGRALQFLDSTLTGGTIKTTGVGAAFTNQPANDGLEIGSSSAADTTQTVTVIGTTQGTDTVVVETITLTGTTFVSTVKTDWGVVLAVKKSAATAGTVTVREASGNATVTAGLTAAVLSVGVETVTAADQQAYNVAPTVAGDGATTKQIGLGGTNSAGTQIYDSQALSGTTAQTMNSTFKRVTEVYTGDVEVGVISTVKVGAEESQAKRCGMATTAATAQGDRVHIVQGR